MGKLKWLFTEGVTDLTSYRLGVRAEQERLLKRVAELRADWVWCEPDEPCPHGASCKELSGFAAAVVKAIEEVAK